MLSIYPFSFCSGIKILQELCIPSLTFGKKPILNFVTKECLESTVFKRKFNILMLKPENQPMADIQSNFLDAQASLAPIIPVSPSVSHTPI